MAKQIGIDRSHISRIESGNKKVSSETLQRIIRVLGLSTEELFGDEVTPAEHIVMNAEIAFQNKLSEYLTEAQVQNIVEFCSTWGQELTAAQAILKEEPMPSAPDGWFNLSDKDRVLIQRLINRLLKGQATDVKKDEENG